MVLPLALSLISTLGMQPDLQQITQAFLYWKGTIYNRYLNAVSQKPNARGI